MDQQIFNIAVSVCGALAGWWMKAMWDILRDLQDADTGLADKVTKIEVLVAGEYVKKNDFDRFNDAIFKKLDRIEDKVDGKQDK